MATPSPPRNATHRWAGVLRRLRAAPEGERNTLLNWAAWWAGRWVGLGMLDQAQADQLYEAAIEIGLDLDEIPATIASGFSAGLELARAGAAIDDVPAVAGGGGTFVMVPTAIGAADLTCADRSLYVEMALRWEWQSRTYTATMTDLAKLMGTSRLRLGERLAKLREHGLIDYEATRSHAPTVFRIADARHPLARAPAHTPCPPGTYLWSQGPVHEGKRNNPAPVNASEGVEKVSPAQVSCTPVVHEDHRKRNACAVCGVSLAGRSHRAYCSKACRQAAHRRRKRGGLVEVDSMVGIAAEKTPAAPKVDASATMAADLLPRGPVGDGEAWCRYPAHRSSGHDWQGDGGAWHCGVCSPPAAAAAVPITLVKEDVNMNDRLTAEWLKGEMVARAWLREGGALVKLSEADSAERVKWLVALRDGHITAAEFHERYPDPIDWWRGVAA